MEIKLKSLDMQIHRPFESSGLDGGREMTLCSFSPLKSHSDSRVDKSPPSAAKLIEPKIEGEGPTLHLFHKHESSGSGGRKGEAS